MTSAIVFRPMYYKEKVQVVAILDVFQSLHVGMWSKPKWQEPVRDASYRGRASGIGAFLKFTSCRKPLIISSINQALSQRAPTTPTRRESG